MATKLSVDNDHWLNFMETMTQRFRSGAYQYLKQDDCKGTKAIGEALTKFQAALREYRDSKQVES